MFVSRLAVGLSICALTACASLDGTAEPPTQVVLGPVPTGELPAPLSTMPELLPPVSTEATVPPTTAPIEPLVGPIVDAVSGNRILIIGDTVLASTAPRNGGAMCRVLGDFGWNAEVDTEPGRFIEFADVVIEQRLRPDDDLDWDVIAIMLGNHFDGDVEGFEETLDRVLEAVAPRPVVLYTVTELQDGQAQINGFIRSRVRFHPNIVIVDWAEASGSEPEVLLDGDGFDPTREGSDRLVLFLAAALGKVDGDQPGECFEPAFADDSAILL
jgi:hypothetical protein